jgi:hypothetical protein
LRDFAEAIGRDGQLAAAARVRADWADVEMAHRQIELVAHLLAKVARLVEFVRVEIDVSMKVSDAVGHRA